MSKCTSRTTEIFKEERQNLNPQNFKIAKFNTQRYAYFIPVPMYCLKGWCYPWG